MAGNFAALWPTDFKFLATKDLNLLKKHIKNQMASSIYKVVFAFSKWPHLHRASLLASRLIWPALYFFQSHVLHKEFQINIVQCGIALVHYFFPLSCKQKLVCTLIDIPWFSKYVHFFWKRLPVILDFVFYCHFFVLRQI